MECKKNANCKRNSKGRVIMKLILKGLDFFSRIISYMVLGAGFFIAPCTIYNSMSYILIKMFKGELYGL